MSTASFDWKDKPSLIERVFPAQKISAEAQKERKAGSGQTLTGLGSYWKGRKPLILNRACILGALLPATEDPEKDLLVFEKLMGIDDAAFLRRVKNKKHFEKILEMSYAERMAPGVAWRPEELAEEELLNSVWGEVNDHLGTSSFSIQSLVEELGVLRFGHRPRVADTFSGGGSIPFEAARLGCDVFASDLNPVACMLTWAAFKVAGAKPQEQEEYSLEINAVASAVDAEISELEIEHDRAGNRAKTYFYCLETRCPETGWRVPLLPSLVISVQHGIIAKLVPDPDHSRFEIEIVSGASDEEVARAMTGTVQDGSLVYELDGKAYRTSINTLRGDYRDASGGMANRIRRWDKNEFQPADSDLFIERLYAIQWMTADSISSSRPQTFFSGVTEEDIQRELKVQSIVKANLADWQEKGWVPDAPIEPGVKTDEPIRTRGWTYWHQLFSARHLLFGALFLKHSRTVFSYIRFCSLLNRMSKLCRLNTNPGPGRMPKPAEVFDNQALNTQYNYAERASLYLLNIKDSVRPSPIESHTEVRCCSAEEFDVKGDIIITDPPYADAIRYHEITEFFISWIKKFPREPFDAWLWDSRRTLAIKGTDEEFRRKMIASYKKMAERMPDNGIQIVMFTHQDAGIWADMTSIVWGAGLQVTAAWYIATETTSELKKGGYVQGTVLLVLRKRLDDDSIYRDELVEEVREEVAKQIETMTGLNQQTKGHGRTENLFEDADLQMAGYAAALRVLTGYRKIDGQDMAAEALRPRQKGERDIVKEIIDYAVMVANEHLVPEGLSPTVWERCTGVERFYLKMLDIESAGLKKLDNYQNFAKAFRVSDYGSLMASMKANSAKLKNSKNLKKAQFEGEFGKSPLRALLFAIYEIRQEMDTDEVMGHLRDLVPGYHTQREHLMSVCQYIAQKREDALPDEAGAARVLLTRIKNERLGD